MNEYRVWWKDGSRQLLLRDGELPRIAKDLDFDVDRLRREEEVLFLEDGTNAYAGDNIQRSEDIVVGGIFLALTQSYIDNLFGK